MFFDLLFIVTLIFCRGFMFITQYLVSFLVLQASPWERESWSPCNACVHVVVICYCSLTFPCGALGWSSV